MASFPASVIIPTLDRADIVHDTLRMFENQSFKDFELIVLDQTTGRNQQLSDFQSEKYHYKYHQITEKSLPNARNVAAGIASGNVLIFVDDDVLPEPDLVRDFLAEFENSGDKYWLIGGRITEKGSNILSERKNIAGGYLTKYGKTLKNFSAEVYAECEWVAGGNFAIRRETFLALGGFDTNYIGNAMLEDTDFGFRVRSQGGRILFSPKPELEHTRAKAGGTRCVNVNLSMYYRSHNTVYCFIKNKMKKYLPIVFLYLLGITIKDLLARKHTIGAFINLIKGFNAGLNYNHKLPVA